MTSIDYCPDETLDASRIAQDELAKIAALENVVFSLQSSVYTRVMSGAAIEPGRVQIDLPKLFQTLKYMPITSIGGTRPKPWRDLPEATPQFLYRLERAVRTAFREGIASSGEWWSIGRVLGSAVRVYWSLSILAISAYVRKSRENPARANQLENVMSFIHTSPSS
jgi:hypothetical protein